jgi:hypothetical protein
MGIVLKAVDTVLQRVVAVKAMTPALAASQAARKRFIAEARAAASVVHEHVVTIHAVQEGKVPYLVMQLVAGVSLEEKIDRCGPLHLKEILRIGMQIASGLAAAHAQGLVHRDVKPANILLENGIERVKITDFGLARQMESAGLTSSGTIAGTPAYMAPEQARGEHIDFRADLFALGSVLYTMCTGVPQFAGNNNIAILRRVCEDEPRPIAEINPAIPPALAELIARLHRKEPAERPASAAGVAELLEAQLAEAQASGVVARAAKRPPGRPHRTRRIALGLTAVVGAALLVAAAIYFSGWGRAPVSEPAKPEGAPVAAAAAAWQEAVRSPKVCAEHTAPVFEVALAPNGLTAASASEDKTIRLWDVRTGMAGHVLSGHGEPIHALAFSPRGDTLASGSDSGEIRIWSVATGGLINALAGARPSCP